MARINRLFINEVDSCVDEMLQGFVNGSSGNLLLEGYRVVIRDDLQSLREKRQVTVICGGGSGHEPFAAGYVGKGMLSAAVAGSVFTSPPPNDILAALKAVSTLGGTLVIVANYTGDRLNFGIAIERAKALGLEVAMVVVGEDCALQSSDKTAGRRGLVGIMNIIKIAGALAEEGRSLKEIQDITARAAKNMGTIGVSLSACSIPGRGASFDLPPTEMEVGLGAHGEAGVKRMKLLPADQTIEVLINHMTDKSNPSHLELSAGEDVALTMNNLGGLSELEMYILSRKAIEYIESKGVRVTRFYFGHFMSSLDMSGFNLNVLKLDDTLTSCLDCDTTAPGWPNLRNPDKVRRTKLRMKLDEVAHSKCALGTPTVNQHPEAMCNLVMQYVRHACEALIKKEQYLNELDTAAGDGDCGSTLKRGCENVLSTLESLKVTNVSQILQCIADCAEDSMGGASGGLYSLFFTAASHSLTDVGSLSSWCSALESGIAAITRYGGAEPGDRTMLDALVAINRSLLESNKKGAGLKSSLQSAATSAYEASQATTTMKARAGRASYVAPEQLTKPDAGAAAVSIWMGALSSA